MRSQPAAAALARASVMSRHAQRRGGDGSMPPRPAYPKWAGVGPTRTPDAAMRIASHDGAHMTPAVPEQLFGNILNG